MKSISKEESLVIDKMFSWCASSDEIINIKKSIAEVRNGNGLYNEVLKHKGDLLSLKHSVADYAGLNIKASGELSRVLWHIVKPAIDRERMTNSGIICGIWIYTSDNCKYPHHEKLNGKKFPLTKGIRIGLFKKIRPQQLVGCHCFIKPVLPF